MPLQLTSSKSRGATTFLHGLQPVLFSQSRDVWGVRRAPHASSKPAGQLAVKVSKVAAWSVGGGTLTTSETKVQRPKDPLALTTQRRTRGPRTIETSNQVQCGRNSGTNLYSVAQSKPCSAFRRVAD